MNHRKRAAHRRRLAAPRLTLAALLAILLVPLASQAQPPRGGGFGGRSGAGTAAPGVPAGLAGAVERLDLTPLLRLAAPGQVTSEPELRKSARQAFQTGSPGLALQYYFGHIVGEYDQADEALQVVGYSSLLRRPVWQIRWGVSFAVRGDIELEDYQPIRGDGEDGRGENPGGFASEPGALEPGALGEPPAGRTTPQEGEMEGMEAAMPGMDRPMQAMDSQIGGGASGKEEPAAGAAPATMLDPEARENLRSALGLVADVVASEMEQRFLQGDFGKAYPSLMASPAPASPQPGAPQQPDARQQPGAPRGGALGPESGFGSSMQRRPAAAESPAGPANAPQDVAADVPAIPDAPGSPMWIPGFVYLGEGRSDQTAKTAQAQGLDLLLHFDVRVKQGRGETVQNVSRCRVVHAASGKTLGVSKAIDSREAKQQEQLGRTTNREYVEQQVANLWDILDRQVKVQPLPELSAEIAQRRVGSLIGGSESRRLRTLAEIRLYQFQNLLSAEQVEQAFHIAGGDDALVMLHGPPDQVQEVVVEWVEQARAGAAGR